MASAQLRALLGDDLGVLDPLLRPVQRLAQARLLDRLQQVVDGVHLERAHRVLVVGGDERDQRQLALLQHPHDADAVELRHLQVEQRQIRALLLDRRHRLAARRRLRHDHDVVERAQQRREKRSRRPFVVGDHDAQAGVHDAFRVDAKGSAAAVFGRHADLDGRAGVRRAFDRQRGRVAVLTGQPPLDVAQADAAGAAGLQVQRLTPAPVSWTATTSARVAAGLVEPRRDRHVAATHQRRDAVLDGVFDDRLQQQAAARAGSAAPPARRSGRAGAARSGRARCPGTTRSARARGRAS